MLVANKTFQMRANEAYTRGEPIPPAKWATLPLRTQNALKGARFVMDVPDAPVPAPQAKRGK